MLVIPGSCGQEPQNFFRGSFTRVDAVKEYNAEDIYLVESAAEVFGANDICIADTLLIANTDNPDNLLNVYHKDTFRLLGGIIPKGRGPGEDESVLLTGEKESDTGVKIGVQSRMFPQYYTVDILNSLEKNRTVTVTSHRKLNNGNPWAAKSEALAYGFIWDMTNYTFVEYNPSTGKINKETKLYREDLEGELAYVSGGKILFKPDLSSTVKFCSFINQADFIDIDGGDLYSLSTASAPVDYRRIISVKDYRQWHVYYEGGGTSDRYAVGIFLNNTDDKLAEPGAGCELHIFNWDRTLEAKIRCPKMYRAVAHDEKGKKIYAMTRDEIIDVLDISFL